MDFGTPPTSPAWFKNVYQACPFCQGSGCSFCTTRIAGKTPDELFAEARECVEEMGKAFEVDGFTWDRMPRTAQAAIAFAIEWGRRVQVDRHEEIPIADRFRELELR